MRAFLRSGFLVLFRCCGLRLCWSRLFREGKMVSREPSTFLKLCLGKLGKARQSRIGQVRASGFTSLQTSLSPMAVILRLHSSKTVRSDFLN